MPWGRLSVQSKILIVMMAVSIVSVMLIGYLGYRSGRSAIEENSLLRLGSLRQLRTDQLQSFFADARGKANLMSRLSADEMREFRAAYEELARTANVTPEQEKAVQDFYVDVYLPKLAENLQSNPSVEGFLPTTAVQEYLQYYYTVPSGGGSGADIDDPGDGSAYSKVHSQRHPLIRSFLEPGEDLIFIDDQSGDVIYTANKNVDLGTNLLTGPYSGSALADAFREARKSGDADFSIVTDFDNYRPNYGGPAVFIASPVFDQGQMIGVVAVQVSAEKLVKLTSGDAQWRSDGLGDSGDVYLVGPDNKMRSQARGMIENVGVYTASLLANGFSSNDVARVDRLGTTIDTLPVTSKPIEAALRGDTGTIQSTNYLGDPVLSSFSPLQLQDLHWAIIAEINQEEALTPAQDFTQLLAIYTVCIILFVIFAGLFLTWLVTKPLRQLTAHARQVAAGDYSGDLNIGSHDEVGELASAFNDMTQSLRVKQSLIDDQNQMVEKLLLNVMPETLVSRYKQGDSTIADHFPSVSILFADISHFTENTTSLSPKDQIILLNRLVEAFDDAAARVGVEKVKTIGTGYMAASGLQGARVDHGKRIVDFAIAMQRIIDSYDRENNATLGIRVGIDAGPVEAGIVGRSKFVYDLWGETVNMAYRIHSQGDASSIIVSDAVYRRVRDLYTFTQVGTITTKDQVEAPIWQLQPHRESAQ